MSDAIPIRIVVGGTYKNRDGESITINVAISRQDTYYREGYRFADKRGRLYTSLGRWSETGRPTAYDLIEKI